MKIVKEHIIFEKFKEDSDPIHDMGIGMIDNIKKWIKDFVKLRSLPSLIYEEMFKINNDLTIDVEGDLDLSYKYSMETLPIYIKFNHVKGDFHCVFKDYDVIKNNGPNIVEGNYQIYYDKNFTLKKDIISKYCKVKGKIIFINEAG